jgi:hypothetical protein
MQYPMQKIKVTHAMVIKTMTTAIGGLILYYLYVIFLYKITMFIMLHFYIFMLHYDNMQLAKIKNYIYICCI